MQNQINLIDSIVGLLQEAGHNNPTFWLEDADVKVAISQDNDSKFKRIYVNRFWRRYLGNIGENTLQARYCLDDNEEINSYLHYFKILVVPFVIKNQ